MTLWKTLMNIRFEKREKRELRCKSLYVSLYLFSQLFHHSGLLGMGCPENSPKLSRKDYARNEVYKDMPFSAGEVSEFELKYYGVLVGYGTIEVKPPRKHKGKWVRVFSATGQTGDWYKHIFVGRDFAEALSHPADFAVEKFYLKQDEGKIFGKRLEQEKWFDFDHSQCWVKERIKKKGDPETLEENSLVNGATDALSIIFEMRTRSYQVGKVETAQVHTSKKDWLLEAYPEKIESVQVPAGTYKAVKLKLKTYLGKELQQKGNVFVWISTDLPQKPLVKMEGEIKLGSVTVSLSKYIPGQP